jgi:pimeloyl-ACP methyl ester carboxylesterase
MSDEKLEQGYFRTRDGVRLYYCAEGPKDAPVLLFCYGLVCSKLQWKYQWDEFRHTHRVVYMDYRGHGQSEKPADPTSVTIETCARDLLELLDEIGAEQATVIGHSLGVNIILDLYRLAPSRVRGLVLANGTPKDPFETMFHHNFLQVAFPVVKLAQGLFPDFLQKFWAGQGTNPVNQQFVALAGFNPKYAKREDINEYLRLTSTVDLDIFLNLLTDFMKTDATHWLHEVKVPTLVMAGSRDLITPKANQRIFAELIPGAEFHEIREGSHCPQMEKPALVNALLATFFKKVERAAAASAKNPAKKAAVKKALAKKTAKKAAKKAALKKKARPSAKKS